MKALLLTLLFAASAHAADLPPTNVVLKKSFASPYSCGAQYADASLFMSAFSQQRNAPDFLYYGNCGEPGVRVATVVGDWASISDLGDIALPTSIHQLPVANPAREDDVQLNVGRSYYVTFYKGDLSGSYAFHVDSIQGDAMKISYVVFAYAIPGASEQGH